MNKVKPLVLIVDDDPRITEGLSRRLRSDEFALATASSGEEAMPIVKSRAVALVICDEMMPFQSGVGLLMAIKDASPNTVRVMLTGAPSVSLTMRAINRANVFRFLTKPCDISDLRATINEGIKIYQSQTASQKHTCKAPELKQRVYSLDDDILKLEGS